jgi:hypothetical protein
MKPWFAWVNIIANRYRRALPSSLLNGDSFGETSYSYIHPSAGKKRSANFAMKVFCELRVDGVLGNSEARGLLALAKSFEKKIAHPPQIHRGFIACPYHAVV